MKTSHFLWHPVSMRRMPGTINKWVSGRPAVPTVKWMSCFPCSSNDDPIVFQCICPKHYRFFAAVRIVAGMCQSKYCRPDRRAIKMDNNLNMWHPLNFFRLILRQSSKSNLKRHATNDPWTKVLESIVYNGSFNPKMLPQQFETCQGLWGFPLHVCIIFQWAE